MSNKFSGESPLVRVENLTVDFNTGGNLLGKDKIRAVNSVSFNLYPGRAMALVGESGSGKSTCARALVKLNEASGGSMFVGDKNVNDIKTFSQKRDYAAEIQIIFQDPFGSLNSVHTIEHHLERPVRIHNPNLGKEEVREKVLELLRRVGLRPEHETAMKHPHELSGGQRQRVAIARALAMNAKVILADEPISMLDVSIRLGILNLMEDMKNDEGIAFLYITHDIATARYFAEDIAVLYVGHMVEWGDSTTVTSNPTHPYTKLLISSIPDPKKRGHKSEVREKSEIPQWKPESKGCPFVDRCPLVKDICRSHFPEVTQPAPNHFVRCHAVSEENQNVIPFPGKHQNDNKS